MPLAAERMFYRRDLNLPLARPFRNLTSRGTNFNLFFTFTLALRLRYRVSIREVEFEGGNC